MALSVRGLRESDEARWRELWAGYLDFYRYPDLPAHVTDHTWAMLTATESDAAFAFAADLDGRMIGFVHIIVHANTWIDKPICYLEDLYVDPRVRRCGAGRAMIDAVIARAKAKDYGQVYWRTADDNPARALYDQVAEKIDFVTYVHQLGPKAV